MRISNNGEFIHANPASSGAQGNTNVTNGCINLSTGDAEQCFNTAVYGDPVEVTGTSIQLSYADGDIWDWAVDWDEWKSMSALSGEESPSNIPSTAPITPTDAPTLSGTPPPRRRQHATHHEHEPQHDDDLDDGVVGHPRLGPAVVPAGAGLIAAG